MPVVCIFSGMCEFGAYTGRFSVLFSIWCPMYPKRIENTHIDEPPKITAFASGFALGVLYSDSWEIRRFKTIVLLGMTVEMSHSLAHKASKSFKNHRWLSLGLWSIVTEASYHYLLVFHSISSSAFTGVFDSVINTKFPLIYSSITRFQQTSNPRMIPQKPALWISLKLPPPLL